MDHDQMSLTDTIAEELLGHLRGGYRIFDSGPRTHATFDTAFYGCFRVEIDHGRVCRVAIEHVGGDGVFDWSVAERRRRDPSWKRRPVEGPLEPPTEFEVAYRVEVFDADREQGRALLAEVEALDWGEPTPEIPRGRDGVVMGGSLSTVVGVRRWTTWSPEPAIEPAKSLFFERMLDFALGHGSGELRDDLANVAL